MSRNSTPTLMTGTEFKLSKGSRSLVIILIICNWNFLPFLAKSLFRVARKVLLLRLGTFPNLEQFQTVPISKA